MVKLNAKQDKPKKVKSDPVDNNNEIKKSIKKRKENDDSDLKQIEKKSKFKLNQQHILENFDKIL